MLRQTPHGRRCGLAREWEDAVSDASVSGGVAAGLSGREAVRPEIAESWERSLRSQQVYLAHGGQMTGDEMALIGVGLAGALIIPIAAMAFVFTQKRRSASESEGGADDVSAPEPPAASATHSTTAGSGVEGSGR